MLTKIKDYEEVPWRRGKTALFSDEYGNLTLASPDGSDSWYWPDTEDRADWCMSIEMIDAHPSEFACPTKYNDGSDFQPLGIFGERYPG